MRISENSNIDRAESRITCAVAAFASRTSELRMKHQNIALLRSTVPNAIKAEESRAKLTSDPVYVRSSNATVLSQDINRAKSKNLATDGTGRVSTFAPKSMAQIKESMEGAAEALDTRLAPGDAIDLGRLNYGTFGGYLCRKNASGDGYVVQTHEQATSAPWSGMTFPTASNRGGELKIDTIPVTNIDQMPLPMYAMLHSIGRFVSRQPMSELLMGS